MHFFLFFVLAAAITMFLTPISARFAKKIGAIDAPDGVRKIHGRNIPYGGGLAMFSAFFLSLLLAHWTVDFAEGEYRGKLVGIFLASFLMLMVGLFDDMKPIKARTKFLFQIVAAIILILFGYRITYMESLMNVVDFSFWSIPITILWIVGVTNTLNLIDGLDGLAAGIAAIACTTIFVISFITGNTGSALLAAILAGSCIGFLPQNFNPAKVFMGDAGSYFIGIVISVISMEGGLKSATFLTVLAPILAIGIPIFDTAFAIIRRTVSGRPLGEPDRGHIHHKFLDFGFGQRRAVVTMYFINAVFGMGAVAFINGDWDYGTMFFVVAFFMMILPSFNRVPNLYGEKKNRENSKENSMATRCSNIPAKGTRKRVLTVFGTRPEVIKMAPLIKELQKKEELETLVCVTGQHREQLDQMLEIFHIKPEVDLNLMKSGQTLAEVTYRTVQRVDEVLEELDPDLVMVHGDPSASFASALAAFYRNIPIAHVEAGLRSGNIYSPFPEEYNRRSTGLIATLHFAATEQNRQSLLSEGVSNGGIHVVGNTAIDAVFSVIDDEYEFENNELKNLDLSKRVIVMTAHRRENLGDRMRQIFRAVRRVADEYEDVIFVYAVHLNPKIREIVDEILVNHSRIKLLPPLGYRDMCNLMKRSYMVLTDSGGLQEEAPALGKPVVLTRTETERQEAIDAGTVRLAGVEEGDVYEAIQSILDSEDVYSRMATAKNPYGDGHTSERIADIVVDYFRQ